MLSVSVLTWDFWLPTGCVNHVEEAWIPHDIWFVMQRFLVQQNDMFNISKSWTAQEYLSENCRTVNAQMVRDLLLRVTNNFSDDIPPPYKELISNLCKNSSISGLLQCTSDFDNDNEEGAACNLDDNQRHFWNWESNLASPWCWTNSSENCPHQKIYFHEFSRKILIRLFKFSSRRGESTHVLSKLAHIPLSQKISSRKFCLGRSLWKEISRPQRFQLWVPECWLLLFQKHYSWLWNVAQ